MLRLRQFLSVFCFFAGPDFTDQHPHSLPRNNLGFLADRGKGIHGFRRDRGIIKADQLVIGRQCFVFPNQQVEKTVGTRVIGKKDADLLPLVPGFDVIEKAGHDRENFAVFISHAAHNYFVWKMMLVTVILKSDNTLIRRCQNVGRRIDMKINITVMRFQQPYSFQSTCIIVAVNAADELILPLNANDRNAKLCQTCRRNLMTHHQESFHLVGHQFPDILFFLLFIFTLHKDHEFIAEFLIGLQNVV